MKKMFSLFMAAMLLPLALGAQALNLQPNQKLMGHYTTDDLTLGGCWGMSLLSGVTPIGTDLTPDELALFQGSKIVAFRVGLSTATPVSRVFVIPIDPNGKLGEETEWPCQVGDEGWNLIELDAPYLIDLPEGYSLRIGFDYEQQRSSKHKPISAVKVGDIYPTLCVYKDEWHNYGTSVYGNLSVQCITENDNYPQFIIRVNSLEGKKNCKLGDELTFSFKTRNLGGEVITPGNMTFDVAIDGTTVNTLSNTVPLGNEYITIQGSASTAGLTSGEHTLTVTTGTLNGQPLENPTTLSYKFKVFENGFSRQMRLVEQFTSTYCTWCPLGSANLTALCELRDDIAWVGVHQNMSGTDVFRTLQCDSIADLQNCTGYPEGSFDRFIGSDSEDPTQVCGVLSYNDPNYGASYFNNFLESVAELPSWATVYVNSTYDAATRQAVITINGDLVPNYEDFMGSDSRLTVYITEDGLVASQYNQGSWVNDYVHNGVLRQALVSVKGVALKKTGNAYKNEFTVTIPTAWNADNLNIVAFISRPLGGALNDIYVTNANKRKLGEFDEPSTIIGDVTMDGSVAINDASELIDYLLRGSSEMPIDLQAADCNNDNIVDIADVSILLDYLMSGQWIY